VLRWVKISFILVNETIKGDKSFIKEWFCFLIVDVFHNFGVEIGRFALYLYRIMPVWYFLPNSQAVHLVAKTR